jgi:hypothetical protein
MAFPRRFRSAVDGSSGCGHLLVNDHFEEARMDDQSTTTLPDFGAVGVDESRVRAAVPDLLLWAGRRVERRRRLARASLAGALAGGLLLGGGAVAATIADTARRPVPTGVFDHHWIVETSTGQVCDIWVQVEADPQLPATGADLLDAELDAGYARAQLDHVDISTIDYLDGFQDLDFPPNGTQGEWEAFGITMALHRIVGDLRRDGDPLMVSMSGRPICDPESEG